MGCKIFKESVVGATEQVVGYKVYRKGKRGSALWTDELKEAVEKERNKRIQYREACHARSE